MHLFCFGASEGVPYRLSFHALVAEPAFCFLCDSLKVL